MVGIIGAMESEIEALKENIAYVKSEKISGVDFFCGKISGNDVVVAKSGVGKVFAAVCAEAMILNYHPDVVIHIGIAGALSSELGVKDLAIASSVVQHDIDQTAFGMPRGYIQGLELMEIPCSQNLVNDLENCAKKLNINYKTGVIASGDQFINDEKIKSSIANNFNAIAVEMEGAATGQVCYVNGVEFCIIRAMSDVADSSTDTYVSSKYLASDVATKIIIEYLYSNK